MSYMEFFNAEAEVKNIENWIKEYFSQKENMYANAIIGISGGKDSTIAATLLTQALGKERVIGVTMPQGKKSERDTKIALGLAELLGIQCLNIDIESAVDSLVGSFKEYLPKEVLTNIPPRIRMTTLFAVAQKYHGRVCNTSNYSEMYVGYSTKFGDSAGDFAILKAFTVKELMAIGKALGIPDELLYRPPADGLTGKTDEDNLGFTYKELDDYILDEILPKNEYVFNLIKNKNEMNSHKNCIFIPQYTRTARPNY